MDVMNQGSGASQPRPAFGLRPWFAFLRRARSLRRFAFAMARRVLVAPRYRPGAHIALTDGEWRVESIVVASSFRERLAGIHADGVEAILLHAFSVHGKGLEEAVHVVHVSRSGVVVGKELLTVGGSVRARAYWVLELSCAMSPPPEGARLRVLPSSPG